MIGQTLFGHSARASEWIEEKSKNFSKLGFSFSFFDVIILIFVKEMTENEHNKFHSEAKFTYTHNK